jgi:hypothetical protein
MSTLQHSQQVGAGDATPVSLRLSTVLGEEMVNSTRVQGLVVKGLSVSKAINLPCAYTRNMILASLDQVPRPSI